MRTKSIIIFIYIALIPTLVMGIEWLHYPHKGNFDPGDYISLSNITKIQQSNNNMYFACWVGGIDILKPNEEWERIDYRNTLLAKYNDGIKDLAVNNDTIYAATNHGLLIVTDKDTIIINGQNSELNDSILTHLTIDKLSNIWFTTNMMTTLPQLIKYDGNELQRYSPNKEQFPKRIQSFLTTDKYNNIWYLSYRAVVKFDGENFTHWDSTNSPINNKEGADCLYYNENTDEIYVAFSVYNALNDKVDPNGRLFKIHNGEWTEIDLQNKLNMSKIQITSLNMDSKNNLFFLVVDSEVSYNSINKFYILSPNGDLQIIDLPTIDLIGHDFLPLKTIFIDEINDYIWIGTTQNGVLKAKLSELPTSVETKLSALPGIWIRKVVPNPVLSKSKIEFFCEPRLSSDLSIKIYDVLGVAVKDITNDLQYNPDSATGFIDFTLENISQGIYYLNIRSLGESRTVPIYKF